MMSDRMTMQSCRPLHSNAHHMFCFRKGTEEGETLVVIFACISSEGLTIERLNITTNIEFSKKPVYSECTVSVDKAIGVDHMY